MKTINQISCEYKNGLVLTTADWFFFSDDNITEKLYDVNREIVLTDQLFFYLVSNKSSEHIFVSLNKIEKEEDLENTKIFVLFTRYFYPENTLIVRYLNNYTGLLKAIGNIKSGAVIFLKDFYSEDFFHQIYNQFNLREVQKREIIVFDKNIFDIQDIMLGDKYSKYITDDNLSIKRIPIISNKFFTNENFIKYLKKDIIKLKKDESKKEISVSRKNYPVQFFDALNAWFSLPIKQISCIYNNNDTVISIDSISTHQTIESLEDIKEDILYCCDLFCSSFIDNIGQNKYCQIEYENYCMIIKFFNSKDKHYRTEKLCFPLLDLINPIMVTVD